MTLTWQRMRDKKVKKKTTVVVSVTCAKNERRRECIRPDRVRSSNKCHPTYNPLIAPQKNSPAGSPFPPLKLFHPPEPAAHKRKPTRCCSPTRHGSNSRRRTPPRAHSMSMLLLQCLSLKVQRPPWSRGQLTRCRLERRWS